MTIGKQSIDAPSLPSAAELKRAEEMSPGSAKKLLEAHISALERYEERLDAVIRAQVQAGRHIQFFRMLSVLLGTFLASASLGLCGFAIYERAELSNIAWVLGPVTGLAGVFVWGYRPKETAALILPGQVSDDGMKHL